MFVIAYVLYGDQPQVGASADELVRSTTVIASAS
jgi:hypothetical protein